jgi:DNA-directed RNA polymerase beta' subunit
MALELFKPFVMKRLVDLGIAQNIKSAKRMVERSRSQVWDVLEEVIRERPVLLNRAPTLHRLGIQAFEPLLVEGKAIQLHPLVCAAFNADFDGDQMAVHLPLSVEAQAEARLLMLASNNILKPSDGKPVATPSQDMIIGLYFMTTIKEGGMGEGRVFGSLAEAQLAFDSHNLDVQALVKIRLAKGEEPKVTTLGRTLFAQTLPEGFVWESDTNNENRKPVGKKEISKILERMVELHERAEVARSLDRIKDAGFYWATRSGVSMAISDANFDSEGKFDKQRAKMILEGEKEHTKIQEKFDLGGINDLERRDELGALWFKRTNEIQELLQSEIPQGNSIRIMVESGARGNWIQIRSVLGMRGPVATSSGDFAPMPVKGNYLVGLTANEYFINATGARKGNADTAMKTAAAGYLTRRLVDVAQDVIVRLEDCGTDKSSERTLIKSDGEYDDDIIGATLLHNTIAEEIVVAGKVLAKRNDNITYELIALLKDHKLETVRIRSVLGCEAPKGVCAMCYGNSLATNTKVEIGEAVGIIAAQSIGEPGTQLTMRTFHTGGAASAVQKQTILKSIGGKKERVERLISYDITQGLTGVTDLLEARPGWRQGKVAVLGFWRGILTLMVGKDPFQYFSGLASIRTIEKFEIDPLKQSKNKVVGKLTLSLGTTAASASKTGKPGYAVVANESGVVKNVVAGKYIEVEVDRTPQPRMEPGIHLTERKQKELSDAGLMPKQEKLKVKYELRSYDSLKNPVFDQEVLVEVGSQVLPGQVLADGLIDYPITNPEAFEIMTKYKVKEGSQISFIDLISQASIIKTLDVQIVPPGDELEEAEKTAQNYSFSRSTSKTFQKLSPTEKIASITLSGLTPKDAAKEFSDWLLFQPGEWVTQGDVITDGTPNPHHVLSTQGPKAAEYTVNMGSRVIYGSQGVPLHSKHLEVITRALLGKVTVIDSGETDMLPGEVLDLNLFQANNREARTQGKKPASARRELMGMTRASLAAQSWLSAASFQETTRVLTQAALDRREDKLEGLKENVIIGKLIPAGTGLKLYRDVDVQATEEAKAARYPNRIWDAPAASAEVEDEFAPANLFSANFDEWAEKKEE